jgi:hypothetical protein
MTGRWKPASRDGRLVQLKAFGLFILGTHTLYEIAVKIGIAEQNYSTAAGRARTKVAQGWAIIVDRKVARWDRYWSGDYPLNGWQTLSGARLWTHPRADVVPPAPDPTPFERLLADIAALETQTREAVGLEPDGRLFLLAADGLRNLRVALRHNHETNVPRATSQTSQSSRSHP